MTDWATLDPLLRTIYDERTYGHLKRLASDHHTSVSTLSRRALKIGCVRMNTKRARFSEEETEFMIQHYPISGYKLVELMRNKGFPPRSRHSLYCHYHHLREYGRLPDRDTALVDQSVYTIESVAELLGISRAKVCRWLKAKLLKANEKHFEESKRYTVKIARKDLHDFLKTYPSHWNSKVCDHYWLVDILSSPMSEGFVRTVRQETVGVRSECSYQAYAM
jgi:hypothetical protein